MNCYLLQYLLKIGTNVFCLLVYVWFSKKNLKFLILYLHVWISGEKKKSLNTIVF